MKKKIMVWKNKVEQLFANRRSIQTIIGLVTAVIIMTAVTKFLIAFFQFLQKHYIKILLLIAYIITAHVYDKKWKEKRVKEKNQTNRAVDNKKAKKITYNNLLFVVHELGILRSKLSNIILIITDIFNLGLSKELYITLLVSRELFDPTRGNPLRLKKGQHQPAIRCEKRDMNPESYVLKIILDGFPANEIRKLAPVISSALIGEVNNYAVTSIQEDITSSVMYFIIEDVAIDHRLVFSSVEEMRPPSNTKLLIDTRTILDLTASGSILLSAKTRSGKTTGIVALAIQLLMCGPDQYGSEVLIIDPKRAELSLLPYTVTVKEDENGEGRAILAAVQRFADSITTRQSVLNALSEADGDAVHWWEAAMHPSFLVLDEFVTIRTLFPKRPDKSDSD